MHPVCRTANNVQIKACGKNHVKWQVVIKWQLQFPYIKEQYYRMTYCRCTFLLLCCLDCELTIETKVINPTNSLFNGEGSLAFQSSEHQWIVPNIQSQHLPHSQSLPGTSSSIESIPSNRAISTGSVFFHTVCLPFAFPLSALESVFVQLTSLIMRRSWSPHETATRCNVVIRVLATQHSNTRYIDSSTVYLGKECHVSCMIPGTLYSTLYQVQVRWSAGGC